MNRLKKLAAAGLAAAALLAPGAASAQAYPSQDLHFICAFPPGSGADVIVRWFAEKMRPIVGRNIIVENRSGANGNVAATYTARSKPDGYTIFVHAGSTIAANMSLFKNPPISGKDLQLVATIHRQPWMIVVDKDKPWKNIAELTAFLKEKGDKASYASAAAPGTVMGELYNHLTGVKSVEVLYKNAPDSLNDMQSGAVDYGVHDPQFSAAQAREGRLRILGISTGERIQATPDLPTMKEQGVDMDLTIWWSAQVAAGTPKPIVDQLNKWFSQLVSSPEAKAFLNGFGGDPFISTPEEAQARFLKDIDVWREYVKTARIVPQG